MNLLSILHPVASRNGDSGMHRFAAASFRLLPALGAALFFVFACSAPARADQPLEREEFARLARLRASALAALEFTRALDAVTAVHGPQDLTGFDAREAARRLRSGGWTDPLLPFEFDAAPLVLDRLQRFRAAAMPEVPPEEVLELAAPRRLSPERAAWALEHDAYPLRWYALACLARHPGRGGHACAVLDALTRERMPALVRAYADALKPLALHGELSSCRVGAAHDDLLRRLDADPADLDARCLGLLLAHLLGRVFPGADATLVLAQLERGYPVQTLESEVRALPPVVLETLADGLRRAWAQPQDRLAALLARFPEHGPSLEALAHALLNRNHAAYSGSHRALVRIWEQLTGIDFRGSEEPFLQWYHAHKPMPPLP